MRRGQSRRGLRRRKVFYNTLDNYTVAGDARSGQEVWKTKLGEINKGESRYEVLKKEGALRILRQPPLDSLTVGLWERLGALIRD